MVITAQGVWVLSHRRLREFRDCAQSLVDNVHHQSRLSADPVCAIRIRVIRSNWWRFRRLVRKMSRTGRPMPARVHLVSSGVGEGFAYMVGKFIVIHRAWHGRYRGEWRTLRAFKQLCCGAFLRALEVIEPDLLIFGFGLNVTSYPVGPNPNYEARMDKAFSQVKPLLEKVPCLIVGPYPVAAKVGTRLQLSPTVSKVLEIQQRVRQKYGCTFLDRFERFGGASALEKWRRGQPRMLSTDNTHLTREFSTNG